MAEIHETQDDRDREWIALGWLMFREPKLKIKRIVMFPQLAKLDALLEGEVESWGAEVKWRNNRSDTHPDLTIDVNKLVPGLKICDDLKLHYLLQVVWQDGFGVIRITQDKLERWHVSRQTLKNPRDAGDVGDAVFHIPIAEFRRYKLGGPIK